VISFAYIYVFPSNDALSASAAARNDDDDEFDDEFDTRSRGSSHRSEVWAFSGCWMFGLFIF
jgi:hypothetical protein